MSARNSPASNGSVILCRLALCRTARTGFSHQSHWYKIRRALHLSHAKWECKYYLVRIPMCRWKALLGALRNHLGEIFWRLAGQKENRIEEGRLMPNHVHLLISILPKYVVSQWSGFIRANVQFKLHGRTGSESEISWGCTAACVVTDQDVALSSSLTTTTRPGRFTASTKTLSTVQKYGLELSGCCQHDLARTAGEWMPSSQAWAADKRPAGDPSWMRQTLNAPRTLGRKIKVFSSEACSSAPGNTYRRGVHRFLGSTRLAPEAHAQRCGRWLNLLNRGRRKYTGFTLPSTSIGYGTLIS